MPVARNRAGSRDPLLRPLPLSVQGDPGRGRDPEGIRRGAFGPPTRAGRARRLRRRGRRHARVLARQGDAVPRDARADPEDPGDARSYHEGPTPEDVAAFMLVAYTEQAFDWRPSMAGQSRSARA